MEPSLTLSKISGGCRNSYKRALDVLGMLAVCAKSA